MDLEKHILLYQTLALAVHSLQYLSQNGLESWIYVASASLKKEIMLTTLKEATVKYLL